MPKKALRDTNWEKSVEERQTKRLHEEGSELGQHGGYKRTGVQRTSMEGMLRSVQVDGQMMDKLLDGVLCHSQGRKGADTRKDTMEDVSLAWRKDGTK